MVDDVDEGEDITQQLVIPPDTKPDIPPPPPPNTNKEDVTIPNLAQLNENAD